MIELILVIHLLVQLLILEEINVIYTKPWFSINMLNQFYFPAFKYCRYAASNLFIINVRFKEYVALLYCICWDNNI